MQKALREGKDLTIVLAVKVVETDTATVKQQKAIHAPTETMTKYMIKNKSTRKCRYCSTDPEVKLT